MKRKDAGLSKPLSDLVVRPRVWCLGRKIQATSILIEGAGIMNHDGRQDPC